MLQPGIGGKQGAKLGDADQQNDREWRRDRKLDCPSTFAVGKQGGAQPHCTRTEASPVIGSVVGRPNRLIARDIIGE